jgi:hypothetical protein
MIDQKPTIEMVRKEIVRQMPALGYKSVGSTKGVYIRAINDEISIRIGFPLTRAFTNPPVADVGPVVGLIHFPTEKLYNEISGYKIPLESQLTINYAPHQIDKHQFHGRRLFPLDSTVPSKVAEMIEEVDRAGKVLAERYPTAEAILAATYTDPTGMECRRPFVLLVLGRTREARAFAEYGLKELGDDMCGFARDRRQLFHRIIEHANTMERARSE